MTTHWEDLWDYMDARMLWTEKVVPHLLCSVGAHIANLRQQEHIRMHDTDEWRDPIWYVLGEAEALGLAVLIVSPSGFMKTYPMKILLGTKHNPGLLPFRTGWGGMITEAGFVGTVFSQGDDEPRIRPGMAWDYREGIVAFDEASNVLSKDKVDNNVDLVNAVIKAIGDNFVVKRLSGGELDYWTCISLWLATQPKRLYMVGGLNRRVLKSCPAWQRKHVEDLKLARRDRGMDARWDPAEKERIRLSLQRLMDEFDPEEIVVPERTEDWLDDHCKNHFEKALMERALVGKHVLTHGSDNVIELRMDKEDKEMLKGFLYDQKMVEMGAGVQLVYQTLEKPMTMSELWIAFQTFSDDYDAFKDSVSEARKRQIIKIEGATEGGANLLARA